MTQLSRIIAITAPVMAIDCLAAAAPEISKAKLKDAMSKGAVVLRQGKQVKRLRRAQTQLAEGARLELHYDANLLQRQCAPAQLVADEGAYSVWYKPAGMLSQGNEWGDHLSILRAVELHFANQRQVFLVHRLDREASGLMLIAHTKAAAAQFNQLLQGHGIQKNYHIQVCGDWAALPEQGVFSQPLDGKTCETRYRRLSGEGRYARYEVNLISGRKHQIRRHFAAANAPITGDPRYGEHNQHVAGLALQAVWLAFDWQHGKQRLVRRYQLPAALSLWHRLDPSVAMSS